MGSFDLLKRRSAGEWAAFCDHAFVLRLGDGSLPAESFRHYLKQDYRFLMHFARAWGLAVYKSRTLDEIESGLSALRAIIDTEMSLHRSYCAEWGIGSDELEGTQEARATMAYSRYVLDAGHRGDLLELHVALAPCILGYAQIGRTLAERDRCDRRDNPYLAWIEMYAGEAFQHAANAELAWLDGRLAPVDEQRLTELTATFREATRLEADFWQMSLELRS